MNEGTEDEECGVLRTSEVDPGQNILQLGLGERLCMHRVGCLERDSQPLNNTENTSIFRRIHADVTTVSNTFQNHGSIWEAVYV